MSESDFCWFYFEAKKVICKKPAVCVLTGKVAGTEVMFPVCQEHRERVEKALGITNTEPKQQEDEIPYE